MARVVVCDTSPIRYLVLIGESELLCLLYSEVLIPASVADELRQPETPDAVRLWMATEPEWLKIIPSGEPPAALLLAALDRGERDAILVAIQASADLVIMDDREGVEEARRLGLTVTGTLGVLLRAADRGLIALLPTIAALRQTNFCIEPSLLDRIVLAENGGQSN